MTAISRSKVKIWIADADTNASTLTDTGGSWSALEPLKGEIKSYSKSGGEEDVESDPVFGGFVDKEKPITQLELSFDIVPSLEDGDRWDSFFYAKDTQTSTAAYNVYTLASDTSEQSPDKAVFIQATDGTEYRSWGFNTAKVTMLDLEHNADDNQTYSMTLKFSPTTSNGVSNFMIADTAIVSLPDWSALDNN